MMTILKYDTNLALDAVKIFTILKREVEWEGYNDKLYSLLAESTHRHATAVSFLYSQK